jgi:hypothetical protein
LPSNLNRRQVLFLDGMRHAAEIADLSYVRLCSQLTELAFSANLKPGQLSPRFTAAFLDAWAFVDAVDRLRSLVHLMPGLEFTENNEADFRDQTRGVRDLRNVADHLAQRVDYVIAQNGSALGYLAWFTFLDESRQLGKSCCILPGTASAGTAPAVNPAGRIISPPTGLIRMSAGGYTIELDDVLAKVVAIIRDIEASLSNWLLGHTDQVAAQSGSDLLVSLTMQFGKAK